MMPGKVHFIGAGPGDPELLTVKGRRLIREAGAVLYAGSLVPAELAALAADGAEVADSSGMTLEETQAFIMAHVTNGRNVARLHTGDPSLYGAVMEQIRLLEAEGVECEIVPGVTAAFAAAARAGLSFTVPGATQSLIITRMSGRTPVPETESIAALASHGCAMAVYLSADKADELVEELSAAGLARDTPVILAHRVGMPEESILPATLGSLAETARKAGMDRQTVFLVLPGVDKEGRSRLYDGRFSHGFRE
jgi:precorrin-4/cobalt-precorrin-4 C11-methyltransferase